MNRRSFLEKSQVELSRARRLHRPLTLVLMDIDHFKQINDAHGHPCGDQVLVEFSKVCTENIREFDVFARFGGEEFILLMPEADLDQAFQVSERLRLSVAERSIHCDEGNISITASLGIATLGGEHDTLEQIIQRADQALYRAKQAGRNRSVIWEKSLEAET
jgi:diguanylate cyclase (GGDEF)-like protein